MFVNFYRMITSVELDEEMIKKAKVLLGLFGILLITCESSQGALNSVSLSITLTWNRIYGEDSDIDSSLQGDPDFYYYCELYQNSKGSNTYNYVRNKKSTEPIKSNDNDLRGTDFGSDKTWNLGSSQITVYPNANGDYKVWFGL